MKTPQNPYPTIPQRLVRGFLALVGVSVLYVASSGPMCVLSFRTGFPSNATLNTVYTPLDIISYKTSTRGLLYTYWGWWIYSCEPKGGYKHDPRIVW